jgi:hypothetical protein
MSERGPWNEFLGEAPPQKRIKQEKAPNLKPDLKRQELLLQAHLHGNLSVLPMELIALIGVYVCKEIKQHQPPPSIFDYLEGRVRINFIHV